MDGLERGGHLFGAVVDDELVIERSSMVRDADGVYFAGRVRLPIRDLLVMEDHLAKAGWRSCGDWHVHPRYQREGPRPSEADRCGWQALADRTLGPWVGLIVAAADESDWPRPHYSAWIAEPGRSVISPVRLVIERVDEA